MKIKGIFVLFVVPALVRGHCFKHKDCYTCTQHKTWSRGPCRWCPLDRACHAKWSPKNDCLKHQNIQHKSQCRKTTRHHAAYNATKAYKLASFSAMAYSDTPKKCLNALYPSGNFSDAYVHIQACDDFLFDYDKQCLVFLVVNHDEREIIVTYRGTRGVKQILDQALTIIATPSVTSSVGGKVQRYFQNVHSSLYNGVKTHLKRLLKKFPHYTTAFTGHSLGGAAASIASATLVKEKVLKKDRVLLYTYGMPRVGNKIYAEAHDKLVPQSWRVVRDGDPLARFPICRMARCSGMNGPYHHKTKVLYTGSEMGVKSGYVVCNGNEDSNSRCKTSGRRKRGVFTGALNAHKNYFGIPIGTYCINNVLKV